jgi:hypothetical protein
VGGGSAGAVGGGGVGAMGGQGVGLTPTAAAPTGGGTRVDVAMGE